MKRQLLPTTGGGATAGLPFDVAQGRPREYGVRRVVRLRYRESIFVLDGAGGEWYVHASSLKELASYRSCCTRSLPLGSASGSPIAATARRGGVCDPGTTWSRLSG
jgi:hypothetical protein